jgi:hypothetical protein
VSVGDELCALVKEKSVLRLEPGDCLVSFCLDLSDEVTETISFVLWNKERRGEVR